MDGQGDRAWCSTCASEFRRGGEGGLLWVRREDEAPTERPGKELARAVESSGHPERSRRNEVGKDPAGSSAGQDADAAPVERSAAVRVRKATVEEPIRARGETLGFYECLGEEEEGVLELTRDGLLLRASGQQKVKNEIPETSVSWQCKMLEIGAIQTSSSSVQIAPRSGGLVHFKFIHDSPKRWEELLQRSVRRAYLEGELGEIAEFQPRVVAKKDPATGATVAVPADPAEEENPGGGRWAEAGKGKEESLFTWYGFLRLLAKALVRLGVRLEVVDLENVPASGAFILVANHQSVLDPIIVQSVCPRPLHTFTKSTQFSSRLLRWVLVRVNGIPTRRYRVDPQVVRIALRRLEAGLGVGIYPEGERSWDGTLQPFRQGTVRFLLKAGVPIVPCGLDGSYDVWPRWSRRVRRRRVRLRFGKPIRWAALRTRRERDAALPRAAEALREALLEVGAWNGDSGEVQEG
jgi:1-acyl-sn-glycerol-3-phosphate acyltransferase